MLPNFLKQRANVTPNRIAIEIDEVQMTFQSLHQEVEILARKIASENIQRGDIVAVFMNNSLEMIQVIHALKYVGAVTLLLNTRLSIPEIEWQLSDTTPTLLITDDKIELAYRQKTINEIKGNIELDYDCQQYFEEQDTDTIMYTSGTTGNPKGVMLTYGNHYHSAIGSVLNLGLHGDDCWLACLPFFHVSGYSTLMKNVIYGMRIVVLNNPSAEKIIDTIQEKEVTIASVVTKLAQEIVTINKEIPSNFRCLLLGGGPAPVSLLEKCEEKRIPVFQTYGMTETASQIVTLSPEYARLKIGSAGKALFPCDVKVVKDGKEVESTVAGEIIVRGPNVTKGYYGREEATKESIVDGWLHTGDVGYIDEEGFLFVLDRRKDMFISGGENVYPSQIENVLLQHDSIMDAGVIGIEDESWGKVPCAFVVGNVDEEEVIRYCVENLAKYKVPKKIVIVDELPRNASKKLLRRKLYDWLEN